MPLIDIQDLRKTYVMGTEEVHALDGVTLSVQKGEFVSIMGASGSGKSTLMNLVGCLDTPSSGSYRLNEREVAEMDDNQLAEIRNREIGFIFQTFNLLPRTTALLNVELPLVYSGVSRAERHRRAEEALESVGLKDRMKHMPNQLSGGQRQRVAVARALVTKPSIILADEPTGNLDSKTTEDLMVLLEQLNEDGHTLLLVTHEQEIGERAKRIIRLKDGKVLFDKPV
ncbi:MAG: ABC transporter ATP-binding protein [Acidobacteria bacterium]|nr:MAG: ABC transporter ATP-binding protein [Acidobacteriota bacterium]